MDSTIFEDAGTSTYPVQLFELQNSIMDLTEVEHAPTRTRTMKEYDQEIANLRKENFDLKLQLYIMEQKLIKSSSNKSAAEISHEVNVLKNEIFLKASEALESQEKKHHSEMEKLKKSHLEVTKELKSRINDLEKQLETIQHSSLTAEESDSRHSSSGNDWYKQAFSLVDLVSDNEHVETCNDEKHKLSVGELMEIIESQREAIKNLTITQANYLADIEKYKVNRQKSDALIKGLCKKLSAYENKLETKINLSEIGSDSSIVRNY